jgi:prolyl-tRNA synthetase
MVGGLIMCHGDDSGLRVPPRLAPVQAYVMVVKDGDGVIAAAVKLRDALRDAGVRVALDDRVETAFGRRAVDAELKGYPVRVEVGPRDLAAGNAVLVRRRDGSKTPTPVPSVVSAVLAALEEDQQGLYDEALAMRESRTAEVSSLDEAIEAASTGWARLPWAAVGDAGEARANEVGVTVRCLLRPDGSVPDAGDEPDLQAILSRAY